MAFLPLFHPECAPVALDDGHHYVVFSALQWKDANLKVMPKAAKQRFAVLYNQPLEERFMMETLEQAHIQGAMSGVKLVSVHKNQLRIFLSDEVAGTTFHAIEALWEPIKDLDLNRGLEIDFSCEHEACSGRSDYLFWADVKEVLESNTLGIEQYSIPVLHDCAEKILNGDEPVSHQIHVDIRQSFTPQPAAPTEHCPMEVDSIASMMGHNNYLMTELYARTAHKKRDA
ncbi:hypothetical protein [Pseudomonas sp. BE134]|uniref:hypothetical protein n=1 Tax=Pseudomonas sp. BE134 TaxID=2817843 RepID=UPI00285DC8C2|nr:hypothetical protein [Pseudomonas sp. BE134]MDR6927859.1 hypothetical protein [Pseudomonas sp. BE134]